MNNSTKFISMEEFMGIRFIIKEIIEIVKEKLANNANNQIDSETQILISELDTYILALRQGKIDCLAELKFHFLPTSTFQEHALSNNWADEYLILSKNLSNEKTPFLHRSDALCGNGSKNKSTEYEKTTR
jgi:hypothetical protein